MAFLHIGYLLKKGNSGLHSKQPSAYFRTGNGKVPRAHIGLALVHGELRHLGTQLLGRLPPLRPADEGRHHESAPP